MTGIVAPSPHGYMVLAIINAGAGSVTLPEDSASSTSQNRFFYNEIGPVVLAPLGGRRTLLYSPDSNGGVGAWIVLPSA